MSKGSRPRPFSIGQEEYGDRMEQIFGKKPPKQPYVYVPPEKSQNEQPEKTDKHQS